MGISNGQVDLAILRPHLRSDISKASDDVVKVPEEVIEEVVNDSVARLVRGLTDQRRKMVANLVAQAHRNQWGEGELARVLEDLVGLDLPRAAAVERYRLRLVAEGVPRGIARQRARELARRLRRDRARVIARTELARLVGDAKRKAWELAKEQGLIDQYAVRIWHTHRDERMCPVCRPMNGQRAAVGRPYKRNGIEGPPVHPNCRCWETLERGPVVLAKRSTVGREVGDP